MVAHRVSDPNAEVGVPIVSGDLQRSIKMKIEGRGSYAVGKVYVQGPGDKYAERIEFGWSGHQAPRSFMGAAFRENGEKIKKIFGIK
jgi:hypothetical protein